MHIDEGYGQRVRARICGNTYNEVRGTCRWHSSNLPAVLCRLINRLFDYHALRTVTTVKERKRERESMCLSRLSCLHSNITDCMRVRTLCIFNRYLVCCMYDGKL